MIAMILSLFLLTAPTDTAAVFKGEECVKAETSVLPPPAPAFPAPVATVRIVSPEEDLGSWAESVNESYKKGQWSALISLLIMMVVWLTRTVVWRTIPSKLLPWVAAGIGMLSSIASSLGSGVKWWVALVNGFTMGVAASGFWSLVGKHVFKEKEKKDGSEEPTSDETPTEEPKP